jgi:hypothetical protein
MKVEVRPIDIPKWHGKKGKEAFSQAHTIEALYDSRLGGYATGLTEEEVEKYQKKLGVDLSNVFNQEEPHPFYNSKMGRVKLENRTMIFDDTRALDYVRVKLMKASKYVANSMKDYDAGLYPEATHVIFDEEEDIAIKATKIQNKRKADSILSKLSQDAQVNIIQILASKTLRGRSQDFIDVEMDKIMKNDLSGFLKYAQKDKKELYTRASILECIHRNILTKEGTAIFYMSDKIGYDFESTVEWFQDPQNQNMKIAILEKLNK